MAPPTGTGLYAIHYRIMWDEFSYLFYMDYYVPGKDARDAAAWVFFWVESRLFLDALLEGAR